MERTLLKVITVTGKRAGYLVRGMHLFQGKKKLFHYLPP